MSTKFSLKLAAWAMIAALLAFLTPSAALADTCMGADPAVVSVVVAGMRSNAGLNSYTLRATVVNLGSQPQPSNTLQFVDIFNGDTKNDSRGIPPLRSGESYVFDYITTRSAQAGVQTSALSFRMDGRGTPPQQDCNTGNGLTMVTF